MEKLVLFGIMIPFCFFDTVAQAQSVVGAKAGVNLSNFWINESAHLESNPKAGVALGNFYRYRIRNGVAVEADMMFHYLSSATKDLTNGKTSDYHYLGMEIPVYGMMQAELEHSMLYLGLGPFASVGFISRYEMDGRSVDPYKKDKVSNKSMMHRWDFGVGFIVGYELGFGLQFNVNYHLGFRDVLDANSDKATMTSQVFGAGIGYRF